MDAPETWTPAEVHHTSVDGVPVFWSDLRTDPTITLSFAAGSRDLDPRTAGIHHLVEHLVMHRVGHVDHACNAVSTVDHVAFWAQGPSRLLVEFVKRVCRAIGSLGSLTPEEFEPVRATVLTESGRGNLYTEFNSVSARYGLAGLGLSAVAETRLLDWSLDEAVTVGQRWLHRGNAALTSTFEPPPELRIDLPEGVDRGSAQHPTPRHTGRAWTWLEKRLVLSGTVSGEVPPGALAVAERIVVTALLDALRVPAGLIYSVDTQRDVVGADTLLTFRLDPEPDAVHATVRGAAETLTRLRDEGPGAELLDRCRSMAHHEYLLDWGRANWLDAAALTFLRSGREPDLARFTADVLDVASHQIQRVAGELLEDLLIGLPDETELTYALTEFLDSLGAHRLTGLGAPIPPGMTTRKPSHWRELLHSDARRMNGRWSSSARWDALELLRDRLVLETTGPSFTVRYDEIALVGTDRDGNVEIVSVHGGSILLSPSHFRRLARNLDHALAALPPEVFYRKEPATT